MGQELVGNTVAESSFQTQLFYVCFHPSSSFMTDEDGKRSHCNASPTPPAVQLGVNNEHTCVRSAQRQDLRRRRRRQRIVIVASLLVHYCSFGARSILRMLEGRRFASRFFLVFCFRIGLQPLQRSVFFIQLD